MRVNLVIPMAGQGSRFANEGYRLHKPFIDVLGKPMIERVLENLMVDRFITPHLIIRSEFETIYKETLSQIKERWPAISITCVSEQTQGTACTVLALNDNIEPDIPLVIANSDQLIDENFSKFLSFSLDRSRSTDGTIMVFEDMTRNPKWSFVKLDKTGYVIETKEKQPISRLASVGIYFFLTSSSFFSAAKHMISEQDLINGEYYVCPVYNYLIQAKKRINVFKIEKRQMVGLGTPEDLESFLDNKTLVGKFRLT